MKWKKKTCTGLIQACIYMMRPEIITGTFQIALDAPPLLCGHEPEHVSARRNKDTFPTDDTVGCTERCNSYRCCYMYGGVSRMSICPTSRLVLGVTICVLLRYIKAWGLYDDITVHFPCSLCMFFVSFCLLKERSALARFSSMSILCGSIPKENRESLERCMKCSLEKKMNRCLYIWDFLSTCRGRKRCLTRFSSYLICLLKSVSMWKVPLRDLVSVHYTPRVGQFLLYG